MFFYALGTSTQPGTKGYADLTLCNGRFRDKKESAFLLFVFLFNITRNADAYSEKHKPFVFL